MNTIFRTSSTPSTFSTHLKRTHTQANTGFSTNQSTATGQGQGPTSEAPALPPLPKISGDYVLQVFTHKSLRRSEDASHELEDNERLSVLGAKVLDMAVTHVLFKRTPLKKSEELLPLRVEADLLGQQISKEALSDSHIDTWVTAYKLRNKVRCTPDVFNKLSTPEETRLLFYAVAGGIYVGSGLEAICDWLDRLLGGSGEGNHSDHATIQPPPSGPPPTYRPSTPPQKRIKAESLPVQSSFVAAPSNNMGAGIFFAQQPPATPQNQNQNRQTSFMTAFNNAYPRASVTAVAQPYPTVGGAPPNQHHYQQQQSWQRPQAAPAPQSNATYNPLSPAQPHLAFLPLFNQTAAQRKVKVDYQAQFAGPSHAGKWTVQCVVNGIPKGMGAGVTKQVAKEEAARQAFYAMGWA
ncbi:hypothetical protein V5O48_001195 [Marasmius crinis-equi]|uniref:Uncharacterized protein n=1 Tax=Marasmius crinis-equi TaxID=585013 RepID=A0ABR3FZL1_9AGAR